MSQRDARCTGRKRGVVLERPCQVEPGCAFTAPVWWTDRRGRRRPGAELQRWHEALWHGGEVRDAAHV